MVWLLDDIVPSGAARRYWVNYLDLQRLTYAEQESILLEKVGWHLLVIYELKSIASTKPRVNLALTLF